MGLTEQEWQLLQDTHDLTVAGAEWRRTYGQKIDHLEEMIIAPGGLSSRMQAVEGEIEREQRRVENRKKWMYPAVVGLALMFFKDIWETLRGLFHPH
jgi:hypothetical protein